MADVIAVAQITTRPYTQRAAEADRLTHAGLVRSSSGAAELYTDNNTTSITIGGGSSVTDVSLSAGSSNDIEMTARGETTPLSQTDETALTGFPDSNSTRTIDSLIGALNSSDRVIAFVENVSLTTTGNVNLFQVPLGKRCIVTGAFLVCVSSISFVSPADVSFIWSSGGTVHASEELTGLNTVGEVYRMSVGGVSDTATNNAVLRLSRDVAASATNFLVDVVVVGVIVDA